MLSWSDYYPFGMTKQGRTNSNENYRYGFNGKEKDTWAADGNIYDYGFRIYNPQYAKFLSVDPLTKSYPFYTPYQFAGNKPIAAIDLDGLEEVIKIYSNTDDGHVKLEVYDYSKATMSSELIGVEHSIRTHKYSQNEFINRKNSYYDAFAVAPNLFQSGYKEYAGGMVGQNNGFKGYLRGTLTISSNSETGNVLFYDSSPINRKPTATFRSAMKRGNDAMNTFLLNPNPLVERSGESSQTFNNYLGMYAVAFGGAASFSSEASILVSSAIRVGLANTFDDLSANLYENGQTHMQNRFGIENASKIKMGMGIIGLFGGGADFNQSKTKLRDFIPFMMNTTIDSKGTIENYNKIE